jgi:polysaccharide pyruvyl transferase WcaK-like protein
MPLALLAGAFGQGNPGDEALLTAVLNALPPGWDAVAASSDPTDTEIRHRCEAIDSADSRAVARRTASVDAVVVSGGTVFKSLHPSTGRRPNDLLLKTMLLTLGSRALRKRIAFIGVGASKLSSSVQRRLAAGTARCAHLLVMRDEESAALLRKSGVMSPLIVAADPAWTILDASGYRRAVHGSGIVDKQRSGLGDVAVALSHLAGDENLASALAEALLPIAASGQRIYLQPWQVRPDSYDDVDLAWSIQEKLGERARLMNPPRDLHDARAAFGRVSAVLGLRFHSLVAAAAAGVPLVAVAHEEKLSALARRLGQPAVALSAAPEQIYETIISAQRGAPADPEKVAHEQSLARRGLELLSDFLEGGRLSHFSSVR